MDHHAHHHHGEFRLLAQRRLELLVVERDHAAGGFRHRRGAARRVRDERHLAEDLAGAHAADGLAPGDQPDLALEQQVHLVPAHERDRPFVLGEDLLAFGDRGGLARGLEELEGDPRIVGRGAGLGLRIHHTSLGH